MFFPYRGEIVPRVSKPLGHGAWPSPQNAGQEAGSIRYHSGNWTGLASDPQGEQPSGGRAEAGVHKAGERILSLERSASPFGLGRDGEARGLIGQAACPIPSLWRKQTGLDQR